MTRYHPEHGVCLRCLRLTDLYYCEDADEYLCEDCLEQFTQDEAEAAYDRQQAANLESPPESAREEQLRTWKEHQEAHKR